MNNWRVALKSFLHYFKSNLVIALGVVAATAVLTGALIVGDSMRGSLKDLTLDRLGQIDEILVADGFFRAKLAEEIEQLPVFQENYSEAIPAILFPNGTVEFDGGDSVQRAANVNVFGVTDEFWSLGSGLDIQLEKRQVVVNQQLADQFSRTGSQEFELTLRIPKPTQLPSESPLGKTRDLVESLTRLSVEQVVPNESLARFSLHPNQAEPLNIFVPIELLQNSLSATALKYKADPAQANVVFLKGKNGLPPSDNISQQLKQAIHPSFDDLGFTLKEVKQQFNENVVFDYFSLSSDRMLISDAFSETIQRAFPESVEVFTYLANEIQIKDADSGIPYSMVTAVDFSSSFQLESVEGETISKLQDDEIVLNQWSADNLGAKVGDTISVSFFEPETTHGNQVETRKDFRLVAIAKLTQPETQFVIPIRGKIREPIFDQLPTTANDPDLTPTVPGVTDAESIKKWDLPFATKNKIRPEDDVYWNYFRTTPKAFISLDAGHDFWSSRFGETTSFRIAKSQGSGEEVKDKIRDQLKTDQVDLGFQLIPIKRNGIKASAGSTPFDVLFLSLSFFVIAAALILVALLFRLALTKRISEVGLMSATGIGWSRIIRIWLWESLLIAFVGAMIGVIVGVAYAAVMIWGLKNWWVGAISRPFLEIHIGWISLVGGLLSGILVSVGTIMWTIWRVRKLPVHQLVSGQFENSVGSGKQAASWLKLVAGLMLVLALVLSVVATQLGGEAQAGSFVSAGFLVLSAMLTLIYLWLKNSAEKTSANLGLTSLAKFSARRNPIRSTLTIGLVAVATFMIVSISSFHLAPVERGTAGFDWVAESSQAVFEDLNTIEGQDKALGQENRLADSTRVFSFKFKPGQDASCNNLYQSTQPRVLGVPNSFIENFDDQEQKAFAFFTASATTEEEKKNSWRVLLQETGDAIPVLIDKNTAWYSLKVFLPGQKFVVDYDSGESVEFQVVGFLDNTVLQGSLLVSEDNFKKAFPEIGGYRYFLIDEGDEASGDSVRVLEDRLGDNGFDAKDAKKLLAGFLAVQNTYLSTFQTLGALGLLLGTFGLGAVQIRNVYERRGEFGLMRAVGWSLGKLSKMVLLETLLLLMLGLAIGVGAALFATLPHYFIGAATIPVIQLLVMLGIIVVVGIVTALVTSRMIFQLPLLDALRA